MSNSRGVAWYSARKRRRGQVFRKLLVSRRLNAAECFSPNVLPMPVLFKKSD